MQFYTCCFIMYLNQVRIRVKQTYTMLHFVFSLQLHRPMSIDGVRNSTDDSEFARLGYHPYPYETTFTLVTHVKQSLDSYHDFDAYKLLLICYLSLFWLYHRVHISQSKSYIWAIYCLYSSFISMPYLSWLVVYNEMWCICLIYIRGCRSRLSFCLG